MRSRWLAYCPNTLIRMILFHVSGRVNKHKCRTENPQEVKERERGTSKLSVWCALIFLIGPFIFEKAAVTASA
jgi:uncharacterized membrane protein